MTRGKMRLPEQHKDHRIRMASPHLHYFCAGVAIAQSNSSQVVPRHAIETVECLGVVPGARQDFTEGSPIIPPVDVEANPLAQFVLVNLAPPPLVQNVLVAREDGLDPKYDGPVARERTLLYGSGGVALCRRKSVIVADENDVGFLYRLIQALWIENAIVLTKGLVEFPKIFASVMRVLRANLPLHLRQSMQLRRTPPE